MARTLDDDTRQAVALFRYGLIADLVSVRNFVCELFYKNQGIRSLVCERPS